MSEKIEKWIEEALKSEPEFKLRGDFRDRVVSAIRKQDRKSQRKLYFWMVFGIVIICGFGYGVIALFPAIGEGYKQLNTIVPFAIALGILMAGIQYLDKKLVKDKMFTPQI